MTKLGIDKVSKFFLSTFLVLCEGVRHLPHEQYTVPISQYKLQSGHCFLKEGFAKLEDLGIAHVGDQLLRLFAELINLHRLFQVLQERLLVRVILELLNQLFDRFFNVAAKGCPVTSVRCDLVV